MPRGKKYNAAEEHFRKKEVVYQKEIRGLKEAIGRMDAEAKAKDKLLKEATDTIAALQQKVDQLMKTSGLTESEVRDMVRAAEGTNTIMSLLQYTRGGAYF